MYPMRTRTMRAALSLRQSSLAAEKLPFARPDFSIDNVEVVRNPDPVLKYVAFTDESLWRVMERSETELTAAKEQRVTKLLADGTEVIPGKSRSSKAYELRDFVIAVLRDMRGWHDLQALLCDPIFWGWRPFEIVWKPGLKFNGRSYWGVEAVREKEPEKFAFTVDRRLVYVGDSLMGGRILDQPDDQYRWLVATSGSTDNPYGRGKYTQTYLYWYLKSRFLQMFSQGLERSIGMLKVKHTKNLNETESRDIMGEILSDVEEIRDLLSQHNILVELSDVRTELVTDIQVVDGWQKALEYCDDKIKRSILLQNLTSKIDSKGSRAAAEIHYDILDKVAQRDAAVPSAALNDQLIPWIVALNFGEVDRNDLPKVEFLSARPISLEASKMVYDMGGTIDARKLARSLHVPILDAESESEDRDAIPVSKALAQETAMETAARYAPDPMKTPPAGNVKPGPTPTRTIGERNRKVAVRDRQRAAEPDLGGPPAGASEILKQYRAEMVARFLEEAGNPFGSPQRGG